MYILCYNKIFLISICILMPPLYLHIIFAVLFSGNYTFTIRNKKHFRSSDLPELCAFADLLGFFFCLWLLSRGGFGVIKRVFLKYFIQLFEELPLNLLPFISMGCDDKIYLIIRFKYSTFEVNVVVSTCNCQGTGGNWPSVFWSWSDTVRLFCCSPSRPWPVRSAGIQVCVWRSLSASPGWHRSPRWI